MPLDIGQVTLATAVTLAPFAPFLVEAGKASGKKFLEAIAEKGGEKAWEKAQSIWMKLNARLGHDQEVRAAAEMVGLKPADAGRQAMLAEILKERCQKDPLLAHELFDLLGGQEAIQRVTADHGSWVEQVTQQMAGKGQQIVEARNASVIKGVKQVQK